MPGTLLSTKLRAPKAHPDAVPRPHLMERLDQGLTRKLTLVSAPPGFGKTTLLSQWIARRALPVAWLSLDERDNDLTRFLTYLVAALQCVQPGVGRDLLTTLQSPQPLPVEPVLTALVNQMADSSDTVVLVLDDYHLMESRAVHEVSAFLLEYLPAQVHLILSSRADPPLSLARLRGRGQLAELRASDLRFTTDEAARFLQRFAEREVSADAVSALAARTEGWIAGLQMAAVSLHGREDVDGFVRDCTGSNRYILDYLMEEVFRRQPQPVQDFLLKTAILDRLSGSLCDAVLENRGWGLGVGESARCEVRSAEDRLARPSHSGLRTPHSEPTPNPQSQEMLERLERANLFVVPLDEKRRWYRYHRLFADLLQRQLQTELPELVPELHRRASRWFEQHGLPAEAIDQALSARDFERAAGLIDQHTEATLGRGEGATLSRWLGALPVDLLQSQPRLSVLHAAALFVSGRLPDAERWLAEADAAQREGRLGAGERGMMAALRAFMAVLRFDPPSVTRFSSQALECLPETDSMWRGIATVALGDASTLKGDWSAARTAYEATLAAARRAGNDWLVLVSSTRLASIQRARGHLREAADYCRQQLELAEERNLLPVARAGWMHALGNILCEQNQLDSALDYVRKSCELSDRAGYAFLLAGAYRSLVKVLFARGEMAAAEAAVGRLERLVGTTGLPPVIADSVTEWKARLLMARGEPAAAAHLLADRGATVEGEIHIANHANHRCLARLLIVQAKQEEAVGLLDRLLRSAESAGMVRETIETLALRALAFHGQGHLPRALADLERALSIGEGEGYIRTFVNEGPPMSRLLYEAATRGIHPEYAGKLLAAFPQKGTGVGPECGVRSSECDGYAASSSAPRTSHPTPGTAHPASRTPHSALRTSHPASSPTAIVEPLSERELEVLRLVAEGLSNEETARRLVLSLPTVKWHTSNIYGKLGVGSRTQAVAKARALGLLPTS